MPQARRLKTSRTHLHWARGVDWRERLYLDLYGIERTMGSDGTFSTIRGEKYAVRGDAETYLAGALANACVGESASENQSCMV